MVIAQRLVRRICPDCAEWVKPEESDIKELKMLRLSLDDLKDGMLPRGRGCDMCYNTGYTGRVAIYEMLPIEEEVKGLVVDRANATQIKRAAMAAGMRTLRQDGVDKVKQGVTTMSEILRVTQLDIE